jgi:cytochrome c oxidase subunit III
MRVREALDISHLPNEEYGHRDTLWWGVMGLILSESTSFALLIASYFFLRMRYTQWPPSDADLPWFTFTLPNLLLMIATCYPMRRIEKEAPSRDKMWLAKMLALSAGLMAVSCVLRVFEFQGLQTDYNEHSYGSITWALVFMHAILLFFPAGESAMLSVYCALNQLDRKHRADLQTNSVYWYFTVIVWIAVFCVVWLASRVL